jgi:hypothetical protein
MKRFLAGQCLSMLAIPAVAAEPVANAKQLVIKVQIVSGDPDAVDAQVLSAPTIVTTESQSATIQIGSSVPLVANPQGADDFAETGLKLEVKPGKVTDNSVRLDLKFDNVQVDSVAGEFPVQLTTRSMRSVVNVPLGQKIRVGGLKRGNEQQTVCVTVEAAKPD